MAAHYQATAKVSLCDFRILSAWKSFFWCGDEIHRMLAEAGSTTTSSIIESQAPQVGQRPNWRAKMRPHS
jgi:hypothetical protein